MSKKIFEVHAMVTSYCTVYVEAETSEDARSVADGIDGGDWITNEAAGDFEITSVHDIDHQRKDIDPAFIHKPEIKIE